MIPLAKVPYVTIQKRGIIGFNASAHAELGSPKAVELLFDKTERIIGIRGVDPNAEHAYSIRVSGGVAAPVRWTDSLTITRPSPSSLR